MTRPHSTIAPALLLLALPMLAACDTKAVAKQAVESIWEGPKPDELPKMLNRELPFRYPTALYAKKVQGNVTLRIFIDANGIVHPESTLVVEPSGYGALDSAAVRGSHELRFVPAKKGGVGIAVPILFPVFFRHPDAAPLPGDTVLKQKAAP